LGREPDERERERLTRGVRGLKPRAKTLVELAENALFYVRKRPIPLSQQARGILDEPARARVARLRTRLAGLGDWTEAALEEEVCAFAAAEKVKLGDVAQPLRAALTGAKVSPGIFEVTAILGRDEVLGRLDDVAQPAKREPV
jgi:glutamyl-tRNA synthetase